MRRTLISIGLAAIAVAVLATVAPAASDASPPLTGTWSGKTSQDIYVEDPSTGEGFESEWTVRITLTALNGRLKGIYTTVRLVCAGPAVQDVRVLESWRTGKGPVLSKTGAFSVRADGVSFSGTLGKGFANGRFDKAGAGCEGKGSFKAKRKL